MVHPHIGHREQRPTAALRQVDLHSRARRERARREPAAIHRFSVERVRAVVRDLHDHVVRLSEGNAELVNLDGLHRLSAHLHDGHRHAWDAHVKERSRPRVDDAEQDALARSELCRPRRVGHAPV